MLIDIDKEHRECMEKACAVTGLDCSFYTVEKNDNLLRVEITLKNAKLSDVLAFYLGDQFRGELEKMWWQKHMTLSK